MSEAGVNEMKTRLEDMDARWRHVLTPLLPFATDRSGTLMDRACMAGARLLGRKLSGVKFNVQQAAKKGGVDRYLAHRQRLFGAELYRALPDDEFGFVYRATVRDYPHIIKIGFSHDPEKRMKGLRSSTGLAHDLVSYQPGTYFDEALSFIDHRADHIISEWFLNGGASDQPLPTFLSGPHTADQWAEAIAFNREYVARNPGKTGGAAVGMYLIAFARAQRAASQEAA